MYTRVGPWPGADSSLAAVVQETWCPAFLAFPLRLPLQCPLTIPISGSVQGPPLPPHQQQQQQPRCVCSSRILAGLLCCSLLTAYLMTWWLVSASPSRQVDQPISSGEVGPQETGIANMPVSTRQHVIVWLIGSERIGLLIPC